MSVEKPERMFEADFDCIGQTHYCHRSKDPREIDDKTDRPTISCLDSLERIKTVLKPQYQSSTTLVFDFQVTVLREKFL